MFDSPLEWCAVVRQWVALDESMTDCMRLQRCNASVCSKSHLFAAAACAARSDFVASPVRAAREPGTDLARNDGCIF